MKTLRHKTLAHWFWVQASNVSSTW